MMRVLAMAAMLSGALAVPTTWSTVSHEQSIELRSAFPTWAIETVEHELASVIAGATGTRVMATVSQAPGRRLQAGSTLTITYVVSCGDSCDTVSSVRTPLPRDLVGLRLHPPPRRRHC